MRSIPIAAAIPLLLTTLGPAAAHAYLDRAEPRVGSTVATAPHEVSMWFTQNLESSFSRAEVYNSAGARVDQGRAHVDPGNPNVMRVGLKSLPPGIYKVRWRVLSVDTHTTEGSFTFRVGP
jgi:methionine-rich copper-binding protein CopC